MLWRKCSLHGRRSARTRVRRARESNLFSRVTSRSRAPVFLTRARFNRAPATQALDSVSGIILKQNKQTKSVRHHLRTNEILKRFVFPSQDFNFFLNRRFKFFKACN